MDGIFKGKKRGRKSKAEKELEREREREEAASVRGGLGTSRFGFADGELGSTRWGGADEHDEEEDFDDEGDLLGGEEEGKTDTEAEKKNLALLVDAFSPSQSERYDLFKRAKLRKETLRRIVNHALSQSVPASVVTTINGFTKVFAGEIIEKARTVQAEWAEAYDQSARAAFEAKISASSTAEIRPTSASAAADNGVSPNATEHESEFKLPPNPHRGQLLPSHLREALRRYKRDSEGGGVGFSGLSLGNLGVKGAFTWNSGSVGGRRLFR